MSKLEEKIISAFNVIQYNGPLTQKSNFPIAIEGGPKSIEYTELVHFLTNEIRTLQGIDEEVNPISAPEDAVAFIMEVTSFLKELGCPYKVLIEGHVSDRLQNFSDRLLLLDYLLTELMGARILQEKKPGKKIELKLQETPAAKDMRLILQTLRFPKPPANISIQTLFQKLVPTIPIVINKAGMDIVGKGIFNGFLSNQQWDILNGVQEDLHKEYKIRREMLLTRLDVTIQSFQWSDRTKGKDDLFEKLYYERRPLLKVDPDVDMSDLLASRTDIAIIEKTSNSSVRKNTRSSLQKVIIGQVPDRGGRTSEIAPPPPEMPSWQQRSAGPGGRGGGNFNRGGSNNYSRGGGASNYTSGGNYQSNYQSGGGGYQSGGGNYQSSGGSYHSGGDRGGFHSGGGNYQSGGDRGGYADNKRYDNSGGGSNRNYDSFQGKYGNSSSRVFNKSFDSGISGGNKNYDNTRRDSYSSQDYHQSKRAKTYDSFQANKTTYADQYVQERQHNQQYSSRDDRGSRGYRGSRGRSNYQRGGGGGRGSYR
ncbi:protein FAM98B isoform X1 [Diorhabda carinulata]|uniref:protein FAM98B isoform X1 n=1 Tax=Diorhabda carinulata TaxID=1163345 RepID=UPI0025A23362|nr:protein FAM98B isoform X1 [Diorhabda carinulata]